VPIFCKHAAPNDQTNARILGSDVRTHDAGHAVQVGDRNGRLSERRGLLRELLGMAPAAEEGEVAGDLEFDVARRSGGVAGW
jgi:hypothetical protein